MEDRVGFLTLESVLPIVSHQGEITHEDFAGHRGTIKAGDLQWMTAGRGIVHSEMPAAQGTQKGLQLWVNLSSENKMCEDPDDQTKLNPDFPRISNVPFIQS